MVSHGPTLGETNAHGIVPAIGQPLSPTTENPRSSEFLRSLARHYILDPRTSVGTIRMEPNRYGLLEMTITLKVADTQ